MLALALAVQGLHTDGVFVGDLASRFASAATTRH